MSAISDTDTNEKADVIVTNGHIATQDETSPLASAAASVVFKPGAATF